MKLLFTLLLAATSLSSSAQKAERLSFAALPIDSASHLVTYTAVVPVAGATKDQLFVRAKEWAARSFVDSKTAARMDDKEAGTYITRGTVKLPGGAQYAMMLAIYTKDGRYKYVIDQLAYTYQVSLGSSGSIGSTGEPAEKWANYGKANARYVDGRVRDVQGLVQKLAADIQVAMTGSTGAAKSDW
jgi:hypothetical protein